MNRYLIGPSPKAGSPYGDGSEKKAGDKQSCCERLVFFFINLVRSKFKIFYSYFIYM